MVTKGKNYRDSMRDLLAPILSYSRYFIDGAGLLQPSMGGMQARCNGKYLYVPEDGYDKYRKYNAVLAGPEQLSAATLMVFNPFKNIEHTLFLGMMMTDEIGERYRDDDDPKDERIVAIAKRHPIVSDNLPSNFRGHIFEILCRRTEVLSVGIDEDFEWRAVIKALMMFLIPRSKPPVIPDVYFDNLFRDIERIEKRLSKEYEEEMEHSKINISDAPILTSPTVVEYEELPIDNDEKEVATVVASPFDFVSDDDSIFEEVAYI